LRNREKSARTIKRCRYLPHELRRGQVLTIAHEKCFAAGPRITDAQNYHGYEVSQAHHAASVLNMPERQRYRTVNHADQPQEVGANSRAINQRGPDDDHVQIFASPDLLQREFSFPLGDGISPERAE
jgi:hypothetical protein